MAPRRRFLAFAWAGLLSLALALPTPARADAQLEAGAKAFIESLAKQAIASLTDQKVARPDRIQKFRVLFNERFAVQTIGRWILARHWKAATPDEQKEYLKLFEDLMVVSYVDRFAEYAGESLTITKTISETESTATVFSRIERPKSPEGVRVDWRVGRRGDIYKIVDVVVEGTSMSNTLRSDFTSTIRQKGGTVAGLLEELRRKTETLKQESQAK